MKKKTFFLRCFRAHYAPIVLTVTINCHAVASAAPADKHGWTSGPTTPTPSSWAETSRQLQLLQRQVATLQRRLKGYHKLKIRVRQLMRQETGVWTSQQNAAFVRRLATQVLAESRRQQRRMVGIQAGYDNGFFIRSEDKRTELVVNGELQYRYMFTHSAAEIAGASAGDTNGFFFRRARISFSGTILSPRVFYMIQGDFAGESSNQGNFQLNNLFLSYSINPLLNLRFGSYAVPLSKLQWWENDTGLDLQEFPETFLPFDPDHSLGVSLFGDILPNKLSYEVMVNNGSQANLVGYSADALGARDNRLGFYGRIQFAGAGHECDFANEPDLAFRRHFIWLLGAGAGYESQNSTPSAFPAPQQTLMLNGLSATGSAGFVPPLPLNGNIFRATADFSAKYRGWSLDAAAFFQQINDTLPAGATTDNFRSTFGRGGLWQLGWYVQSGYFLVPHRWELVARVGELQNQGGLNAMQTYTLGLNYYLFGYNARMQTDVTYIPTAAYSDPQTGTFINSRDMIVQTQFQICF